MTDERQPFTQELVSAKYLQQPEGDVEPELPRPVRRGRPPQSALEQAMRWVSPLVLVLMVGAGIGLYLKHEASIRAGANRFGERTSNPIDLMMWMGGSKDTFRERVQTSFDEIQRANRNGFDQFENNRPAFEFESVDFENWSQGNR